MTTEGVERVYGPFATKGEAIGYAVVHFAAPMGLTVAGEPPAWPIELCDESEVWWELLPLVTPTERR